jgi:hypothetical protein
MKYVCGDSIQPPVSLRLVIEVKDPNLNQPPHYWWNTHDRECVLSFHMEVCFFFFHLAY